ncbi:AAA family ATPase [bacterium]|jgi:DNA sulfur modification protein DndD|nr:AAA family ATPase [bacterium]MBT3850421.1 AAA family ATPase [bacterium]
MRIKRLLIKNFRPYKNVEIDIDSHIKRIILLGQNDIGKTELLNAIYWCIWGKPLTKLRPFSQWKNEIKSGNKVTGIFNNSAFDNLKQSEILHVCVTLTFELDKNELHDVERDDGLLELSRSIFIEKDSKDSPRFLKLTDDDEEIGFYSNFPVKSTKTFSMFEEDLTMSSWFGHFTLSSTTKNSNLEKSDEPNIDKYKYFPSDEITKFFLLDSTLLRDYLSFKQNENKSNIDNITKVGDLNKLKEKITIVSNEIMKEINKVNKEGENTERDKLEDERNSLLLELDRLNRDIDEVELFDIWTENFKQRMNGVAPKNPFNLDRCGAIKELKCRLKFNDTIINKETQTGADTSEGKELLVNRKNKEISLKNNQRTYNDKKIDISDNYFRLNIMQNTKDNINKFSENNNVLEYTPPKVTKNFLKELIETKLCCCGSELDPKKNKDRVEAIEDLMSKLVDKGTSSQISQIKSRAQDFYNPDQFELIIERLEIDISDAGDAYDQIDNLQKDIKNINIELNRLGGEQKIIEGIQKEQEFKDRKRIFEGYINEKESIKVKLFNKERDFVDKEERLREVETKLKTFVKKEGRGNELADQHELAGLAIQELEKVKEEFQSSMVLQIKDDFQREFESMHWRDDYIISVDEDFRIDLKDAAGYTLTNDASQGGSQMACLAFMKVLSKYSELSMPLVADTPYGNLDNEPRVGVTNQIFSHNDSQVFLFATTAELSTPTKLKDIIFPKKQKKEILCLEIKRERTKKDVAFSSIGEITIDKAIARIKEEASK